MQAMRWLKISTHAGSVGPFALLIWNYWHNQLTANPIQYITFWTGKAALVYLVLDRCWLFANRSGFTPSPMRACTF